MGQRLRLEAGVDESQSGPQARVIVRALQRYGMILADNGSPWFLYERYLLGHPRR